MKDWRGAEVTVGVTVVYGKGLGSHGIAPVVAEVIELVPPTTPEHKYAPTGQDRAKLRVIEEGSRRHGIESRPVYVMTEKLTVVHLPEVSE